MRISDWSSDVCSSDLTVDNPAGGVTSTQSTITTELVEGQAGRALQSESLSQVTSVILFEGTPAEISVDVASTPILTATATGQPGGATADFEAPVVNITTPGDSPIPDIDRKSTRLNSSP